MRQRPQLTPVASNQVKQVQSRWIVAGGIACALLIGMLLLFPGAGEGRLPGYKWRSLMLVDSSKVVGAQHWQHFPVFVQVAHPGLRHTSFGGEVRHIEGKDIRFTDKYGASPLDLRIEKYDPKKGTLAAWVDLDTLFTGKPTPFFVYYGNPDHANPWEPKPIEKNLRGVSWEQLLSESSDGNQIQEPDKQATFLNNYQDPSTFVIMGDPESLNQVLPVTFDYFSAEVKGNMLVLISWGSTAEFDNDYFIIERSKNGRDFSAIGKRAGGEFSNHKLPYSFSDPSPIEGISYYRLKQVSNNRNYTYSPTLAVAFNPKEKGLHAELISSPVFNKMIKAKLISDQGEAVNVSVYSEEGETLINSEVFLKKGENLYEVPGLAALPKGRFVLGFQGANHKLHTFSIWKE